MDYAPAVRIPAERVIGRARLATRWGRFFLKSMRPGSWDFAGYAVVAEAELLALTLSDLVPRDAKVECNVCGWRGQHFYPNVGPGYNERNTLCPGCRCLDRHRSLLAVLVKKSHFFAPGVRIVEVAPMRRLESLYLAQPGINYTSFDIERHAMEKGDITQMRFEDNSVDFFLCFHVLEHIPDEKKALSEIRRVLRPGGIAVLQVPLDPSVEVTYEYDQPDPREVDHVRRYGNDFGQRIAGSGFEVVSHSVGDFVHPSDRARYGFSPNPIYFAAKPAE